MQTRLMTPKPVAEPAPRRPPHADRGSAADLDALDRAVLADDAAYERHWRELRVELDQVPDGPGRAGAEVAMRSARHTLDRLQRRIEQRFSDAALHLLRIQRDNDVRDAGQWVRRAVEGR